jgi:GrpB-like predicted nucleotidyltransferase (UPF0157 family)
VSRLRFALSDDFAAEATLTFRDHERRIRERLPYAEIRHRGGTSVRGVLTTGDVDIHVRVDGDSFESARDALSAVYEPFHRDAWSPGESAFFFVPDSRPAVEIALTVIGSRDDFHHGEAWDRIAADPGLVARYNDLKRLYEGASTSEYDAAKRTFFRESFSSAG